jgi:hypothetical protein
MSDDGKDLDRSNLNPQNTEKKEEGTGGANNKRSIFGHLNSDLQSALNTWENLTEQMADKVSPEEEQLQEVKRLLGELKSKLQDFND